MTLTLYRADGTPKETDYLATPAALDGWHVVGAAGEPPFTNGWVNYGGGYGSVSFRKFPDGIVRVKGAVKNGPINSSAFTLPVGYRPPNARYFPAQSQTGGTPVAGGVYVDVDGTVSPYQAGTNAFLSLDSVSFDTESVTQLVVPVGMPTPPVVPDLKTYGEGGVSSTVPNPWTVTHTDGSPVNFVITPQIDCWWQTSCNCLARNTAAVWARIEVGLSLDRLDASGFSLANGSIMHYAGTSDWNECHITRAWKLTKGVTYTLSMTLTPVGGGPWNVYRASQHMWLAHDGIRPR